MLQLNLIRWLFFILFFWVSPLKADKNSDHLLCLWTKPVSANGYPEEELPYSNSLISHSLAKAEGLLLDAWAFSGYILSYCASHIDAGKDHSSLEDELSHPTQSKALFVLIQALDHPPQMWNQYLNILGSRDDIDIWVPNLPQWGNTSAQKTLAGLEKQLRRYLHQWPQRPIVLIGSSNGARIGLELEIKLRNQQSNIILLSLAGVFTGTHRIWMRKIITDSDFYQECSYESEHNLEVIRKARRPLTRIAARKHLFYVAEGDFFVAPLNSSLLTMGHNEEFYFVRRAGHTSIVNKVKNDVLEKAFLWIQQQENKL